MSLDTEKRYFARLRLRMLRARLALVRAEYHAALDGALYPARRERRPNGHDHTADVWL